jgi:hypothetical protein
MPTLPEYLFFDLGSITFTFENAIVFIAYY